MMPVKSPVITGRSPYKELWAAPKQARLFWKSWICQAGHFWNLHEPYRTLLKKSGNLSKLFPESSLTCPAFFTKVR